MAESELAQRFEAERRRLRALAYRILGSLAEADDAVQDAWMRLQHSDVSEIESLEAWLTTVLTRICLNRLRDRDSRRQVPLEAFQTEPVVSLAVEADPEQEALLAEAVGVALQVVLGALSPAERVAFVLHDMFAIPFEQIARLLERSPAAARQLAVRARRRVNDASPPPEPDLHSQRAIVDAYLAASREGDLDGLVAVLDPNVRARSHGEGGVREVRGAAAVARAAISGGGWASSVRPALVNGTAGAVGFDGEIPFAILAFTVIDDRVATIDVFNDRRLVPRLVRGLA